jgi:hypothetical protein
MCDNGSSGSQEEERAAKYCVREIYVYSFPDPTMELSYMCNGTIFMRLCSSHSGIFREILSGVSYLVSALNSDVWGRITIWMFYFLT